jgi:hypothetical protein
MTARGLGLAGQAGRQGFALFPSKRGLRTAGPLARTAGDPAPLKGVMLPTDETVQLLARRVSPASGDRRYRGAWS